MTRTLVELLAALTLGVVLDFIVRGPALDAVRRWRARRHYHARLADLARRSDRAPTAHDPRPSVVLERRRPVKTGVPYFYVTDLRIDQLRCFAAAGLEARVPGDGSSARLPNVNLLLGDNGSGKSTVLRAIAMAALAPILDSSGFVPYRLVRESQGSARVSASFVLGGARGPVAFDSRVDLVRRRDFEQVEVAAESPYWEDIYDESSPSFFVAGYGAQRRVADEERADPSRERGRHRRRYQRVASLFDETVSLVPFGAWLPGVDGSRRDEVESLLNTVLPPGATFTGGFTGPEPLFRRPAGLDVPFRALSDGFRSYIGWLGDLLFQMTAAAPPGMPLRDLGGIVLVDEVDLLLHPSWQRVVVPTLSSALPNVQFFFTTHSPIVTGTVEAENVLLAYEDAATGMSSISRIGADVHGLNAEQVLLSSYFGLRSTRAPDTELALADLARAAVAGDVGATRQYLRALARGAGRRTFGR